MGKEPSAGGITGGSEATPLVVDGLLYLLTSSSALGLEPETGKQVWSYDVPGGTLSRRGMGYWAGDAAAPPRVYFTAGRRLIALDAKSGQPVQSFGRAGHLDIERQYNGSVTVYRDLLLLGTNAAPGAVRAFEARPARSAGNSARCRRRPAIAFSTRGARAARRGPRQRSRGCSR